MQNILGETPYNDNKGGGGLDKFPKRERGLLRKDNYKEDRKDDSSKTKNVCFLHDEPYRSGI